VKVHRTPVCASAVENETGWAEALKGPNTSESECHDTGNPTRGALAVDLWARLKSVF
jgi:hypothetical protein